MTTHTLEIIWLVISIAVALLAFGVVAFRAVSHRRAERMSRYAQGRAL